MKIYTLKYATEEVNITYGIFSTRQKAENAKASLIRDVDEDMRYYWERELYIAESEIDKIIQRITDKQ